MPEARRLRPHGVSNPGRPRVFRPTTYADAMLAHPDVRRELRAYRGSKIPAARLLGAAFPDAHFVEAGLQELVDRGVLHPVEYTPWYGTPIISPSFAFGCGMGKGLKTDTWEGRRSHRMQWTYRVSEQPLAGVPRLWVSDRGFRLAVHWHRVHVSWPADLKLGRAPVVAYLAATEAKAGPTA